MNPEVVNCGLIIHITLAIITITMFDKTEYATKSPYVHTSTANSFKFFLTVSLIAWWLLWVFWTLTRIENGPRSR